MPSIARINWKTLREKHEAALKAKGIKFERDLGPTADKMYDLAEKAQKGDEKALKEAKQLAGRVDNIADTYIALIKKKQLGNPAASELLDRLTKIKIQAGMIDK